MNLTIIEAGQPPEAIRQSWPSYPTMFKTLLSPHCSNLRIVSVPLHAGATLPAPEWVDAVLITGSASGVYDNLPWIGRLLDFIIGVAAARVPQVGICFGHQALAKAFGARVEKSPNGWGLGRYQYEVVQRPNWMADDNIREFALGVSHQDQVLTLPSGANVFARSAFTPYAGLDYPDFKAASFQGHPEFSPDFCRALYQTRRGTHLSADEVTHASLSLERPVHNDLVGRWIFHILNQNCA